MDSQVPYDSVGVYSICWGTYQWIEGNFVPASVGFDANFKLKMLEPKALLNFNLINRKLNNPDLKNINSDYLWVINLQDFFSWFIYCQKYSLILSKLCKWSLLFVRFSLNFVLTTKKGFFKLGQTNFLS